MEVARSIKLSTNESAVVEFYPDELPADVDDLEQVLQSLWAPLSTWHSCALEYYRQGMFPEFEHVLSEVNEAINSSEVDTDVLQRYKEMSHFNEGNLLIIQTLAADVVMKYNRPLNSDKENKALAEKFSEYIQQLLRIDHFNLVTSLLRGFFSIKEREFKKALTYFRTVEASKSAKNFRQCLFASYLGHGTIEYFNKHFNDALKFFTSAIELYPDSPCGVRVAFAVCCFELQQFDRARAAIDRALYIDPTSVDALLMLALLERVDAHKFKARRAEHYANAYEYCMLVANMDKGNAMAWNHIAQYLFFSWKLVSESASIQDPTTLVMTIVGESNLAVGDIVRIGGGDFSARVKEMVRQGPSSISITLNQPLPSELPRNHSKLRIECKELTYIKTILMKALKCSRVSEVNAESSYLLGRLFQYIGNLDTAVKHFEVR